VNTSHKLILGASAVVFAAGTVVAIVQPGDLGDDDTGTATSASTTTSEVTTTTEPVTTTVGGPDTTEAPATTTLEPPSSTTVAPTTTAAPSTTVPGETTTTLSSGLGASGAGNPNTTGETAETGGREMLGLGLALAAAGLAGRRLVRRSA
jgi:hypothetical protein